MHSVFTGAQVYGAHWEALHDGLDLIEGEAVGASGIAVAEGAREIAFVGETEPDRNASVQIERARIMG
jgi:hypothetical protein